MGGDILSRFEGKTGPYRGEEVLDDGAFSWVLRATHRDGEASWAIKIAKPPAEAGDIAISTGCTPTGVFAWATRALLDVQPDTTELLRVQFDLLKELHAPDLVRVHELAVEAEHAWYAMDLINGHTLRRLIGIGGVSSNAISADRRARIALELAACLQRLEEHPGFRHHGDLKPENVIVSQERVVLIDPGYHGPLPDANGSVRDCIVTTPAYYPWLDPRDDLLAFGIILWELLLGVYPLSRHRPPVTPTDEPTRAGPILAGLASMSHLGRFFAHLPDLPLPRELDPTIPTHLQELLLKALRLRFDDGVLELGPGFRCFAEIHQALAPANGVPR